MKFPSREALMGWLNPSKYSKSTQNMAKGILGVFILGATTGGMGYLVGGLSGFYWGIGINAALSGTIMAYSREIVFWLQGVKPVEEGEIVEGFNLHQIIEEIMPLKGIEISKKPKIGVMNTDVLNAFATGPHPGHAGVAVTRGLLKRAKEYAPQTDFTPEELIKAVLIHELGHVVHRDIAIGAFTGIMASAAVMMSDHLYNRRFNNKDKDNKDKDNKNDKSMSGLTVFLIGWLTPVFVKLTTLMVSRTKETHADETAFYAGYGEQMKHALQMLKVGMYDPSGSETRENLASIINKFEGGNAMFCYHHQFDNEGEPSSENAQKMSWVSWAYQRVSNAFSTHPSVKDRVAHIEALEKESNRSRPSVTSFKCI